MVFQTEKALEEVGDKVDEAEKTTVQADITKIKEILDRTTVDNMSDADVSEINEAKEQLMKDAQSLFGKMYEQAQAGQAGAGPQGAPGADANATYNADDVVDADYKEV
jgi:molecular chaperone DnaK